MSNKGYLLLGTNLGEKAQNLEYAGAEIGKITTVHATSEVYESPAWGFDSDLVFWNQAISVSFEQHPDLLMTQLLEIEQAMGRVRSAAGYMDRVIDIDILAVNNLVKEDTHLMLPHPRLQERKFALLPLLEIAPAWVHPTLHKPVSELLATCPDDSTVYRLEQ